MLLAGGGMGHLDYVHRGQRMVVRVVTGVARSEPVPGQT